MEEIAVFDELGAGVGSRIAISEGREAAMPFYPEIKPIDAYNAAILDTLGLRETIMLNIHKIKQEICDIGDRLYKKGFAAANDGNISYRVGENQVVCTPTVHLQGLYEARRSVHRRHGGQPDRAAGGR